MEKVDLDGGKVEFIVKKYEDFESALGEIVYLSRATGSFAVQEMNFYKAEGPMRAEGYVDPPIYVKKFRNCSVVNMNLLMLENGNLLANSGYHFITPPINITKYDLVPDVVFKASAGTDYLVSTVGQSRKNGFYLGNTDNFGHWLFEFLPKALWYMRIFPNQDIPLLVGDLVPKKWLDMLIPLGVDLDKIERFPTCQWIKFDELVVCGASCRRMQNGMGAVRFEDISTLRHLMEQYFNHYTYTGDQIECLFCTRRNARWRKTKNEEEVLEWLSSRFKTEVFEPELLSIKEQFEMLGKTKYFFATGGSLPFAMFAPKDSVLFEIRPPLGSGFVARIWADLFRFGYHRVATDWSDKHKPNFHEMDLVIDFERFKKEISEVVTATGFIRSA